MNFVSLTFVIFILITLTIFYLTPKKFRWLILLVASYAFYALYNALLVLLIFGITLITFLAGLIISNTKHKKANLIFTLILVFGNLFIFKYFNFSISLGYSLASLFTGVNNFTALNIILPMGISFYTFQTISYVIDVYKEKVTCEKNFFYYNLYVMYFPQLVAGPIERYESLMPQLKLPHSITFDDVSEGIKYILIGYFKKIAIADVLAIYVDKVYGNLDAYSGTAIALATIMFAFQILADFDGYSTIALGISSLMGIKLTKNFDEPYLATNIKDYWKRWHITLTRWFTDYVYIPLGGNRKGKVRKYFNIFIVFLLSGLWHGASITFIIWGIIHGVALIIYNIIDDNFKINHNNKLLKLSSWLLVSVISLGAWVFFRSQSLSDAFLAYKKIFTSISFAEVLPLFSNYYNLIYVLLVPFSYYLISHFSNVYLNDSDSFKESKNSTVLMIYVTMFILIITIRFYLISLGETSSFIYFEF